MPEYRTHSFNQEWHEKVENFIEENDLAFDSPKYFIKYCVNRFMEEYSDDEVSSISEDEARLIGDKLRELGYVDE